MNDIESYNSPIAPTVAVIGLGNMGLGIACAVLFRSWL
jgi:UDP-N-acetyl-D-mannosaminuronate dehydrogenase